MEKDLERFMLPGLQQTPASFSSYTEEYGTSSFLEISGNLNIKEFHMHKSSYPCLIHRVPFLPNLSTFLTIVGLSRLRLLCLFELFCTSG